MVFGAAQTPKIDDFRPAPKTVYKKPKCSARTYRIPGPWCGFGGPMLLRNSENRALGQLGRMGPGLRLVQAERLETKTCTS